MFKPHQLIRSALLAFLLLAALNLPVMAEELDPDGQHHIALILAETYELPVDEINALRDSGWGYGDIARALAFASANEISPAEALALVEGAGWGQLYKDAESSPGGNGLGAIISALHRNENSIKDDGLCPETEASDTDLPEGEDPLEADSSPEEEDCTSEDNSPGNGNGQGNAYGHDKDDKENNGNGGGNDNSNSGSNGNENSGNNGNSNSGNNGNGNSGNNGKGNN